MDKTGGYAFPDDRSQVGMTLRDYMAGQALQGLLADYTNLEIMVNQGLDRHAIADGFAKNSYDFADAMIKARGE